MVALHNANAAILADAHIGNPDNPLLEALFTTVRATYTLKDR